MAGYKTCGNCGREYHITDIENDKGTPRCPYCGADVNAEEQTEH